MSTPSEKFPEKLIRIQQQLNEWTAFEQLYAIVEITHTFQISYRHFLIQLYQANIQNENNIMFNHTVDDANSSDIVTCLLSNSLDKILFTLQLYLPLISTKTINEKLLDSYRDVLIYLDTNLYPTKFSYSEQQIINLAQQIFFFIQINPYLQKLLSHIPKLIYLIQTKKFHSDEQQQQQQHHQQLQRHPSIRSQVSPIMNFSSEGSHNSTISQQLTRHDTSDSGVDLTEPLITNSIQNFLSSSHNQQHSFIDRNLSLTSTIQKKHSFVGKTASSPIPEHGTIDSPVRVPLKGVLSAPPPTTLYSDYRHKNCNYQQQKHISTLAKSDEDEQESQNQMDDFISEKNNTNDNSKPFGQFYSLRYKNIKNNQNTEDVSQYLGVDANSAPARNTFMQPNTGMKDVPRWLKHLRLHKYDVCFSQMTYDEMMNLTVEQLKEFRITDGARTKILINIKKLHERSTLLKQFLIDLDNAQIDLPNLIQQLNELMMTPIRSKQLEHENHSEEDLPKLIIEVLEKIYQQLTPHSSADICHSFMSLIDRCYKNEAFTTDQIHLLLKWRRRLSNMFQSVGKTEYKPNQSTFIHSIPQRRSIRPSVRPMKSSSSTHYSNYSSNSISLSKYNSEPQNNNLIESNLIRRPTKSPTLIYPTNEESNDLNLQTSFSSITSTPQRNNGAYLANHQHQALTRKASIDPYGETNTNNNNRAKLCKTFSDPNRIRFHNSTQINHMQSSIRPQPVQQQSLFRMISTPYSQQPRQFISRSPPTSTMDTLSVSPIKNSYSENERSDYYDNNTNTNDIENSDDQQHNNTELESFCLQITESAINDDANDSLMDCKEEPSNLSNIKQSLNNSPDIEQ